MRIFILVLLVACTGEPTSELEENIGGGGGGYIPPPSIDVAAIAKTTVTTSAGYPAQFQLWSNSIVQRADFFARAAASFHLTATDAMVATPTVEMPTNLTVTTYQLASLGIPVENARYDLIERDGNVIAGAGQLFPGLTLSPTPTITADAAAATAMPAGPTYHWQFIPGSSQPSGELTFYSPDFGATQPFRLVYRFAFATNTASYVAHVDANTGALVDKVRTDEQVTATGLKYDAAQVTIYTDLFGTYRLLDLDKGHNIQTYDAGTAPTVTSLVDFQDADNVWNEVPNRRGVSAHWAAEQAWSYLATYGYKGFDGVGATTAKLASLNLNGSCGQTLSYEDRQLTVLCNLNLDLESVSHELGHQLLNYRALLGSTPETDAIHEGLADIFASSVNRFVLGNDTDWLLFDKSGVSLLQWRDMANPKTRGQPDTYKSAAWATEIAKAQPDGHVLDGVVNKWFYLLAHGGSATNDVGVSYTLGGLGRTPAEAIVLATIADAAALGSTPGLLDLRRSTIANAQRLFGDDYEVGEVAAAWDAVNVIDGPSPSQIWRLPADGAEGVRAWPTQFQFQTPFCTGTRCATEVAWLVEYSTNPDFTFAQQVMVTSQSFQNGKFISTAVANLVPSTVYYWRAKAQYQSGIWSSVWRFTSRFLTGRQQPRDCTPTAKAAGVKPWPGTFSWSAIDGAVGYEIQVATDPQFTQSIVPITNVGPTTSYSPKLPVVSTLYWRVRAIGPTNGRGDFATVYDGAAANSTKTQQETKWSPATALSMHTTDPVPANATADGTTVHPFTTTLAVTPNGASAYQIKWATQPLDCAGNAGTIVPAPAGSATIPVNPSTTIYWCGRGLGYFNDHTSWSKTYTLYVDDGAPTAIPVGYVGPWPVTFQWKPVTGAAYYEVQASMDQAVPFSPSFLSTTINTSPLIANVPIDEHELHWWRVRAFNANNIPTGWSPNTFYINSLPTKPVAKSPSGSSPKDVTFTWQAVSGASQYKVWLFDAQHALVTNLYSGSTSVTTTLVEGAKYSWSVQAITAENYGGLGSDELAFTVQAPPPPCPGVTFDMPIYGNGAYTSNYFDYYVTLPSYANKTINATITISTNTPSNLWSWEAAFFVDRSGGPVTNEMIWYNGYPLDPSTKTLTTGDFVLPSDTLDLYFEPEMSCLYGGSPCNIDIHVVLTCK